MARALLSVKKGATPTTEGRYLETTLKKVSFKTHMAPKPKPVTRP